MKDSINIEKLTAEIFSFLRNNPHYETVEHNVQLEGKDGPRRIDVLVRGKVGPIDILTIIECKDYNKNVNVTRVDELHSKMQDVNAHKAVLVARKGFSKHAIRKAKRLGITLCTAHQEKKEKWEIKLELPVVIEEILPTFAGPKYKMVLDKPQTFSTELLINDINVYDEFKDSWNKGFIRFDENADEHEWQPRNISAPYFLRNIKGEEIPIAYVSFKFQTVHNYYFGYVNELENSKMIEFITEGEARILYKPSDLSDYTEKFVRYDSADKLPKIEFFTLRYRAFPEIIMGSQNIFLQKIG